MQAETYYNRAALLVHSTNDKTTLLAYKLCQARIMDYSRKFLEAASRYHELSWVAEIDEEERQHMLSVLSLPFTGIHILIAPQFSGSDMRRPCSSGSKSVSSSRLSMQR